MGREVLSRSFHQPPHFKVRTLMHREKHSSARGWRGQRMAWAGLETLCVALQAASACFPLPGSPWDSSITALQTGREARLACEPRLLNQEALGWWQDQSGPHPSPPQLGHNNFSWWRASRQLLWGLTCVPMVQRKSHLVAQILESDPLGVTPFPSTT